jgi:hypothetical protein
MKRQAGLVAGKQQEVRLKHDVHRERRKKQSFVQVFLYHIIVEKSKARRKVWRRLHSMFKTCQPASNTEHRPVSCNGTALRPVGGSRMLQILRSLLL